MEYQALYRKWRPARFEDVCGQPHVTDTLKNQIRQGKVGHAYLFTGTRGTGKTTCAKIFAKAVNCLDPKDGEPCGECENCKLFEQESLYDVLEMDAASKSHVEDIRGIIDEVIYSPAKGKRKVYIIDEVQMLTANAFNALLKTLEEPPEYVVFILATTEPQKVPATILSRCQRFDFKRLSTDTIKSRLFHIAQKESLDLSDEAAEAVALLADGAMRDALSILEQCQTAGKITKSVVEETVGLVGVSEMVALMRACHQADIASAMSCLDRFYNTSKRMDTLLGELIGCYRDLILIRFGAEKSVRRGRSEVAQLSDLAKEIEEKEAFFCIEQLNAAIAGAAKNSGNLTVAQICLLRLCRHASGEPEAPAIKENRPAVAVPPAPVAEAPKKPEQVLPPVEKTAPVSPAAPSERKESAGDAELFARFLKAISSPGIRFLIPQKGYVEGNELVLQASAQAEYDLAVRAETQKQMLSALAEIGRSDLSIRVLPPEGGEAPKLDHNSFSL